MKNYKKKCLRIQVLSSLLIEMIKSDDEVAELEAKGIKVLKRRHIECYLFDDEIIALLCKKYGYENKIDECLAAKRQAIEESKRRGNPEDDIKIC